MTVEELRSSREEAPAAYQEFMEGINIYSQHLFCFFEGHERTGNDNDYYVPRIRHFIKNYHSIKCGNRKAVLKVHELISIHKEYDKYKKAFFIDQDFNPPLFPKTPPIFETPCYSIENLYVSVDVFKEILKNKFGLSEIADKVNFEACVKCFEDRQKEFHNAVCLFNAWYACLMDIRNTTGQQTGVNLQDKFEKGFISITLNSVTSHYDLGKIKNTYPNATELDVNKLNEKLELFQNSDGCKVFRGKYEMQFLTTFIKLLLEDSRKPHQVLKTKISFEFGDELSHQQAINVFSAYAETPDSLTDYLKQVTQ